MRQRELEIRLERVPAHPHPDPDLEQYRTPAKIAADVLYRALGRGDVADRSVVDLGCGTGIFLVGAGLLGASHLTGIDLDPTSVELARKTLAEFGLEGDLHQGPVESLTGQFDTAIMNPPFGAQHAQRHVDTLFLQHALSLVPVCYSLHLAETEPHFGRVAERLDATLETLATYRFPLPYQFRFHSKEKVLVPVVLFRTQRMGLS